jgi:hypothetical protein
MIVPLIEIQQRSKEVQSAMEIRADKINGVLPNETERWDVYIYYDDQLVDDITKYLPMKIKLTNLIITLSKKGPSLLVILMNDDVIRDYVKISKDKSITIDSRPDDIAYLLALETKNNVINGTTRIQNNIVEETMETNSTTYKSTPSCKEIFCRFFFLLLFLIFLAIIWSE